MRSILRRRDEFHVAVELFHNEGSSLILYCRYGKSIGLVRSGDNTSLEHLKHALAFV
jgi:hypothetical protein